MSEDLTMWDYWKSKHASPKDAVESHYPRTLENDRVLQQAVAQTQAGELALNARMEQLADEAEDDEP